MRIIEDSKVTYEFENLTEMAMWIDENKRPSGQAVKEGMHGWCLEQFRECVDHAIKGNRQRTNMFSGVLDNVKSLIQSEKQRNVHDVTGETIDIGAYLTGMPECFVRRGATPDKPVISIAVCMSFNAGQHDSKVLLRGAGIVALVDELQDMGYCVEVNVFNESKMYEMPKRVRIKCGLACNPVDIDAFASMCASSFHRRLACALYEIYTEEDWPEGHGRPLDMDGYELEQDGYDFYFDSECNKYYSEERVKQIILKMLEMHQKNPEKIVRDSDAY